MSRSKNTPGNPVGESTEGRVDSMYKGSDAGKYMTCSRFLKLASRGAAQRIKEKMRERRLPTGG
jgi:CRISPR/Cas system-associated exonuclease Cas4 (RecB family)